MDDQVRKTLLSLARETVRAALAGQPLPEIPDLDGGEVEYGGVFVTLRNGAQLRGCIGEFCPGPAPEQAVRRVAVDVQRMAVAVLRDPRFAICPVTLAEFPSLHVEISILSPMRRTHAPERLLPGVHGVYVRRDGRAGCFLPQVAVERGWGAAELLSCCCTYKAGLPADAWKHPDTQVFLFTSEVLADGETSSERC